MVAAAQKGCRMAEGSGEPVNSVSPKVKGRVRKERHLPSFGTDSHEYNNIDFVSLVPILYIVFLI